MIKLVVPLLERGEDGEYYLTRYFAKNGTVLTHWVSRDFMMETVAEVSVEEKLSRGEVFDRLDLGGIYWGDDMTEENRQELSIRRRRDFGKE